MGCKPDQLPIPLVPPAAADLTATHPVAHKVHEWSEKQSDSACPCETVNILLRRVNMPGPARPARLPFFVRFAPLPWIGGDLLVQA